MNDETREAAELLRRWRKDLKAALEEQNAAAQKAFGLRRMIEGMEVIHPELKPSPDTGPVEVVGQEQDRGGSAEPGSVADAVRKVLIDNPSRWFTSGDMVREVRSRGLDASPTAVRLALRRTAGKQTERRGIDKGQSFRLRAEEKDMDLLGGLEQ